MTTEPISSPSFPPLCPTGLPNGSPIERFRTGSCEFAPVSPEGIDYVIDQMAGKSVYGMYASAFEREYASQTHVAVVFREGGTEFDMGLVGIDNGRIVSYEGACGPRTPQEWVESLGLGDPISE